MRSSAADELVRLIPPRQLSLEQALEAIRDDECAEVTPLRVRLGKTKLFAQKRQSRGLTQSMRSRLDPLGPSSTRG